MVNPLHRQPNIQAMQRHAAALAAREHNINAREQRHAEDSIRRMSGGIGAANDPGAQLFEDLYFYLASFGNMAAGATVNATVQLQSDSQFEWMRSATQGTLHGATEPIASSSILPISVFITDTGSGRQLMSAAVPVNLLAGDGKLPFINPASRIFQATATIQITAVNFGASQYDNIFFAFLGRKIFQGGSPV